jgi:phosphoribosylformylglycinamidine (FGAM) synthase-like amidotransferase family enzyme
VIRVFVLYSEQPDPERYEQHVALSREHVAGATIRHGRVLGGMPDPDAAYYFEYEFPDRDAWKAAQDGLMAAGEDAQQMGISFRVYFAEIE